jgi:hypothetical protein
VKQAQQIQVLIGGLTGQVPTTIPQSLTYLDLTGAISSYQPAGALTTSTNAFFATGLGGSTNGANLFHLSPAARRLGVEAVDGGAELCVDRREIGIVPTRGWGGLPESNYCTSDSLAIPVDA